MKNGIGTSFQKIRHPSPPPRPDDVSVVPSGTSDQSAAQVDVSAPQSAVGFGLGLFSGVAVMLVGQGVGGADVPVDQVVERVESEPSATPDHQVTFDVLANPELVIIPSEMPREDFQVKHNGHSPYSGREVGIHLGGGLVYDLQGDLFRAPSLVNDNSALAGIVNPDSLTSAGRLEINRLSEFEKPGERIYQIEDSIVSYTVTLGEGFATIDEHPTTSYGDGKLDANITSDGETVRAEWDFSEEEPLYSAILRESGGTGELEMNRPAYILKPDAQTHWEESLEMPEEDTSSVIVSESDGESYRFLGDGGDVFRVGPQSLEVETARGQVRTFEFEGGRTSNQARESRFGPS